MKPLEILAAMSTVDTERTDQIITTAIAAVLTKLGETSIEISREEITAMLSADIERSVDANGIKVRVRRTEITSTAA